MKRRQRKGGKNDGDGKGDDFVAKRGNENAGNGIEEDGGSGKDDRERENVALEASIAAPSVKKRGQRDDEIEQNNEGRKS